VWCALIHRTAILRGVTANEPHTDGTERRCYEVRVRGPIGPTMMQAFPCLTATQDGHDTMLTGSLPDQSALYGVIHQLEALGLQLLEIRRLPTGAPERAQMNPKRCD
jgi:hypothetical protein